MSEKKTDITTNSENDVALQKNITDSVLAKIMDMEKDGIKMPEGYNAGNALKSAWLTLQTVKNKEKIVCGSCCTKTSIINSLFDMCIQGLSPAKNQCYFIIRGDELTMTRSYFGTVAALKRLNGVSDVFAQVIYKGDEFEYEIDDGNIVIKKHVQKLENIKLDQIIGAYCVIIKDGEPRAEIMTMDMIRQSWTHTASGGKVQNEFPDQMAKRTVLNRGAKMYINTSTDNDELAGAINRTTENEYEDEYTDHAPAVPDPIVVSMPEVTQDEIMGDATQQPEQPKIDSRRKPGF